MTFRRGWAAFILVLTALPYLICAWKTPPGLTYSWFFAPYAPDLYAYRTWAEQAFNGSLLFRIKFTAVAHAPFLFQPFFLVCGWLGRLTRLDLGLVLFLVKSAGVLAFFHSFYALHDQFRLTQFQSRAASVFAGISSGFGGLLVPFVNLPDGSTNNPIDLWLIDSNTFWSLLWNPLYPWSLALIAHTVRLADRCLSGGDDRAGWWAGGCLGLLALVHPYPVVVVLPLLALMTLWAPPERRRPAAVRFLAPALPAIAYVGGLSVFHPLLRIHATMGAVPNPDLLACAVGLGLPLLLALFEAVEGWPHAGARHTLFAWAALALALPLVPFWFRYKVLFGVHLPLCILAALGTERALAEFGRGPILRGSLLALGLALLPWSNMFDVRDGFLEVRENPAADYYIDDAVMAALRRLRELGRPEEIVFASPEASAKVAAYCGNTVMWGHWAQSVDFAARASWLHRFYDKDSGWDPRAPRAEFWGAGVRWVLVDDSWRRRWGAQLPGWLASDADKVFEDGEAALYRKR